MNLYFSKPTILTEKISQILADTLKMLKAHNSVDTVLKYVMD